MQSRPLLVLLALVALASAINIAPLHRAKLQHQFEAFVELNHKRYSSEEQHYRLNNFQQELHEVEQHNAKYAEGQATHQAGVNQWADLTHEEFEARFLMQVPEVPSNFECTGPQPKTTNLPDQVDWSAKSAVSAVRNLGSCENGNYAVVAAETIESGRYLTTGLLQQVSAQQILDCSSTTGNKGCTSGSILSSFEYVSKMGITNEDKYPFKANNGTCNYHITMKEWEILGCVKVTPRNQTMLRAAVSKQPTAVLINFSLEMKKYKDGVFQESNIIKKCQTKGNHWMTMVGYGYDQKSKKKYWKLKNSLGPNWGSNGYIYVVRDSDGDGECGVQTEIYYPID